MEHDNRMHVSIHTVYFFVIHSNFAHSVWCINQSKISMLFFLTVPLKFCYNICHFKM